MMHRLIHLDQPFIFNDRDAVMISYLLLVLALTAMKALLTASKPRYRLPAEGSVEDRLDYLEAQVSQLTERVSELVNIISNHTLRCRVTTVYRRS
ncbi:hypothetical protein FOZ60_010687 [Perkinsus olseni]|uniref:Uncharacterized protein n=1 Tax=Perkinsus olseni TaxID=32597 RepID=A0A7J6PBD0_PEROL|nr:hypothetical protein FOZ60_010687 [Perkinsus olseni]